MEDVDCAAQVKKTSYFIYFAGFTASLLFMEIGGCYSWPSPVIPKLQSNDTTINPLSTPITIWEESFVASSVDLTAFFISILAGVLCDKLGKKRFLLLLNLPLIGAHVLCAFASHIYTFMAARILMGMVAGGVFTTLPAYLSVPGEYDFNRNKFWNDFCLYGGYHSLPCSSSSSFSTMSEWLGMAGSFFILMGGLSVGLMFIVMVVPETKGKNYMEIRRLLQG